MQNFAYGFSESKSLHLEFTVDSQNLHPNEFIGLFECIDIFTRTIIEHEAYLLLAEAGFSDEWRLSTLQRIHKLGRRVPVPAEILNVQKGSWKVEKLLQGAAVIFFLRNYVHPVVQDAWNDSRLREIIVNFIRNKIFLGAKKHLEAKAIEQPVYKGLRVSEIAGPEKAIQDESEIKIRMEKTTIVETRISDKELIEDFIQKLKL